MLWGNVGVAYDSKIEKLVPIGSTKEQVCKIIDENKDENKEKGERYLCHGMWKKFYKYFPNFKTEILYNGQDAVWFVFEKVNKRMKCGFIYCRKKGDGTLRKIAYSEQEALIYSNPNLSKEYEEEERKVEEKRKAEEKARIAKEKKAAEKKRLAEEKKRKEEELKRLVSKHGDKCEKKSSNQEGFEKDTPGFNNCLIVKEKERIKVVKEEAKRLKLEEEKLKNMKPQQRAEYKCINTFGFKKGADNYNECLFKLYSVELELEKMKLEHEIQVQRLALEREKVKAAKAQTEAAKAQAEAAYRSALANEQQAYQQQRSNAQKSINQGMRMLSGACTLGINC